MMRIPCLVILLALVSLGGCATNLVNVTQLQGWEQQGDANWVFGRKTVTGTGKAETGFLISPVTYKNFELSVAFKPDKNVNSGILIRCQDPDQLAIDNCYEINIWDDHPKQAYRTGSIVLYSSPPRVNLDSVGQWNIYRIRASENQISVWLNDTLTAEITAPEMTQGHIALQSAGGVVMFRDLSITPL